MVDPRGDSDGQDYVRTNRYSAVVTLCPESAITTTYETYLGNAQYVSYKVAIARNA